MKKNKDINALLALLVWAIIAFLIGLGLNVVSVIMQPQEPSYKTDTIEWHDTVYQDVFWYDTVPQLVDNTIIKTDTFYTSNGQEMVLETSKKVWADTLTNGEDSVAYWAYTSGYEHKLDSISLWANHKTVTNTIEVTKYVERKKKFKDYVSISPNISFGYGLVTKKIDTYAGVGIAIHL